MKPPQLMFFQIHFELTPSYFLKHLISFILNYLFLWISNSDLLHFADDNIISTAENTIEQLVSILEKESQAAINWFKSKEMIVNIDQFQAITVKRNNKMKDS